MMNPRPLDPLLEVAYYEGLKTPEGKILSSFRGPEFEPHPWNAEEMDWGTLSLESRRLAQSLLNDAKGWRDASSDLIESFAQLVVAKLPTDRKWRLWNSEVTHFCEKIYREKLEGRDWPECQF